TCRYFLQAIQIRALETDDAYSVDLSELLLATAESASRNINRVVVHTLLTRQGFQKQSRFLATPASELCDDHRARQTVNDVPGVEAEGPHSRAAQAVFREHADYVEKRRAHFIVQIF